MCHNRLAFRVPSTEVVGPVLQKGYRFCINKLSVDGSSKCNVVPDLMGFVWGVLYSMNESDRTSLDDAEGLPS